MTQYSRIVNIFKDKPVGKTVEVKGWLRTRRDSKGNFSFLELNDGSCLSNLQIIADRKLANYATEIRKLAT
ncbi:MAG: asparagine--tRNA ligase, partial [Desulfobulbaceae bacterium]|nr:asparagine--tRNA ligase [Desulfobulbaceae bacterium]